MTNRNYLQGVYSTRKTPQNQPIPGSSQVPNSAGGFAWSVDDWQRLHRFLILGSEGGTYYISQQTLSKENAEAVHRCIQADGLRVVREIVEVSQSGRAPQNDPALFALAMAASLGSDETKTAAFDSLPKVARIGTHLFHFAMFAKEFRGWGHGLARGIREWYNSKPLDRLAYQLVKYQGRDGWTHRDMLRLAHVKPASEEYRSLYFWATRSKKDRVYSIPDVMHPLVAAFESAKAATTVGEIVALIQDEGLPREAIPTKWLNTPEVWEALLEKMPMTAMIRNLGKMSNIGLLKPFSDAAKHVVAQLGNEEHLQKARVHPIQVLMALKTYEQGHGFRGKLSWDPVTQIIDALDSAFYASFQNVETTGKNWFLAVDISGSMTVGSVGGASNLRPYEAAAAMSLVIANREPNYTIVGFNSSLSALTISPKQRLDAVARYMHQRNFVATDCALPMLHAMQKEMGNVDVFVIITDNETWYGDIHPAQALVAYRQKFNLPNTKLAVIAMTSNGFSIADPNDSGMLDFVGFDTATPPLLTSFVKGAV